MNESDIKPYEKNAKKHTDEQLLLLAQIVQKVGWRQPVVVNQNGVIVIGHGRWAAYLKFKDEFKLKPCWIVDDTGKTLYGEAETTPLTPELETAYRIADNKVNLMTGIDMEIAIPELKALPPQLLQITGFTIDDLNVFNPTGLEDQDKLGEQRTHTCPECGFEFKDE